MDCYYCKAKEHCMAAAQPGSVVCMVNRMRTTGRPSKPGTSASSAVSRCGKSGGSGSAIT